MQIKIEKIKIIYKEKQVIGKKFTVISEIPINIETA